MVEAVRAFTMGHPASYDRALEAGPVTKIGTRPPGAFDDHPEGYPGGCVFLTIEEAQKAADAEGYAVYELQTPVRFTEVDGDRNLVEDAVVIGRVSKR